MAKLALSLLTIVITFSLIGCNSMSTAEKTHGPLKTVPQVNIPRFMGSWYVIANIPTYFEKGGYNAVENYTWNGKEERIEVLYTHRQDSFDGKEKKLPQKAFIYNEKTNAEWRVQLFWLLKFPYLIADLNEDYTITIIGMPDRKHVWIMARTPQISDELYQSLVKKVEAMGFDTGKLVKVPQKW